jgi:hypothetical protein
MDGNRSGLQVTVVPDFFKPLSSMNKRIARPKCRRCKVGMRHGIALQNGLSGTPDFVGDKTDMTLSPDPEKVNVIKTWKCPQCGHSFR